jgi:hypothetical protein
MKRTLVITDLTQMPRGNEVCVVGVDEAGNCIRPCCDGGFLKDYLYDADGRVVIRHGAKVEFDLHPIICQAPHVEDMGFDPDSITGKGLCNDKEWESVLQRSSYTSVDSIYEGHLQDNSWVIPGANTKSIATLSGATIIDIELTERTIKPRLTFRDSTGYRFNRPASDLTLWDRCSSLVREHGHSRFEVEAELGALLQDAERLYLRLGLARPWERTKGEGRRCWLQVTGVYTFPDYLNGKSFADF